MVLIVGKKAIVSLPGSEVSKSVVVWLLGSVVVVVVVVVVVNRLMRSDNIFIV